MSALAGVLLVGALFALFATLRPADQPDHGCSACASSGSCSAAAGGDACPAAEDALHEMELRRSKL